MKQSTQTALIFCGILAVLLGGIAIAKRDTLFVSPFNMTSRVFADGGMLPSVYTCDGKNVSPPLSFKNVPKTAHSIVVLVEDLDIPRGEFVHWLLYNIDPRISIEEGVIPKDSNQGINSEGKATYTGPCPPPGKTHRYHFSAYAVQNTYNFVRTPDAKKLKSVMKWQVLAKSTLTASYTRTSVSSGETQ